jgi:hypothetical protein
MRFKALLVGLTLLLGGCNRVYSHQPLFHDATGLPAIRAGDWQWDGPHPITTPVRSYFRIRADGRILLIDRDGPPGRMRLFPGDPLIVQMSPAPHETGYFYFGARVRTRDASGRATGLSVWPVDCGPPPGDGGPEQFVSPTPFPDLLVDGDNCLAWTPEAVRNAARASEALEPAMDLVWRPVRARRAPAH